MLIIRFITDLKTGAAETPPKCWLPEVEGSSIMINASNWGLSFGKNPTKLDKCLDSEYPPLMDYCAVPVFPATSQPSK